MDARDLLLSPDLSEKEAEEFLRRFGFTDPARSDRAFREIGDLLGTPEKLVGLLPQLLTEFASAVDPDGTLIQFQSFYEAVPSRDQLTSYLQENLAATNTLIRILDTSPHLTQVLVRSPEYFYWLTSGQRLTSIPGTHSLEKEARQIILGSPETALDSLRRFRRRESLRIAAQDALGFADLPTTVQQLSILADTILQAVFDLLRPHQPDDWPFAVLAMGKLGGSELNYSSDIDLIYVHADGSDSSEMSKFARDFTHALTDFTGEGRLYRVDLRLRPMGRGGQIVYPLSAFSQYYETVADTFDRLALIKCRPAAGSRQVGSMFLESVQHFTYRKYLDFASIDEIRWLKDRTDQKMERRGKTYADVKLGYGGIREIEFFVQSFQLLYGGLHPEIRTPNTLEALDRLVDGGFVSPKDHKTLRNAYCFLRVVEHYLQLVQDLQTHSLPDDTAELARCARRMGFAPDAPTPEAALSSFRDYLEETRNGVHEIFRSLFEKTEGPGLSDLALNPRLEAEEAVLRLSSEGYRSPEALVEGISQLKQAPSFPYAPARMRNLLANLLPVLLEHADLSTDPKAVLNRFDRFCESLGARAELYTTLVELPEMASRMFQIFAAGEFLSETLIAHPELIDFLAQPRELGLEEDFSGFTAAEESKSVIRKWKRRQEFKVAVDYLDSLDDRRDRGSLSALAETCIRVAGAWCLQERPQLEEASFGIFALGKLGGREMTFHSDLDLMMVYDDRDATIDPPTFNGFVVGLQAFLQDYTEAGRAYTVDTRLRPEGRRSSPATPLTAFNRYFSERAEPWEFLAYTKFRAIFLHHFDQSLLHVPSKSFHRAEAAELVRIRERLEKEVGGEERLGRYDFKVGYGGLMDIQFVVQFLQLQSGLREPSTFRCLESLRESGALPSKTGDTLQEGLDFLYRLESITRLLGERPRSDFSRLPDENRVISRFLGYDQPEQMLEDYERITHSIRRVYRELFEESAIAD